MFLHWPEERIRHIGSQLALLDPREGVKFLVVDDTGFTLDRLERYIDHRAAGVGMDSFTKLLAIGDCDPSFFVGFSGGRGFWQFVSFDFSGGELPGKTAFLDATPDEQYCTILNDHGGRNRWPLIVRCLFTH